jgi:hypothetical protein
VDVVGERNGRRDRETESSEYLKTKKRSLIRKERAETDHGRVDGRAREAISITASRLARALHAARAPCTPLRAGLGRLRLRLLPRAARPGQGQSARRPIGRP